EKKLVEIKTDAVSKFLGGNKKNILILVKSSDAVFVDDDQLSFLTKLLEACKLNVGDVAILNNEKEELVINKLKEQLRPKRIILFGNSPGSLKLPIEFPMFKLQQYDGSTYLYAPSLKELDVDTTEGKILKSKLWVCLKNLFEL
ncbi:MAG: hypothetical protein JST13_10510, partial [Bacteroidetes bacterium]|nr:hypothetical protein [Bacteroidota bacterium]